MIRNVILDTGPLVSFLHAPDYHHAWAREIMREIEIPLLTCEAIISEACFLLGNWPAAIGKIGALISSGVIEVSFSLPDDSEKVFSLMHRYRNVPMSFADACLVRMSERLKHSHVLTLDSDFEIYRRNQRQKIPVLAPWSEG